MVSQLSSGASPLKHPQAKALYQAVLDAFKSIQVVKVKYDDALVIAAALESEADGELVIQQQGRKYRAAVQRYCDAVMAWLIFMDSFQEDISKAGLEETRSGPARWAFRHNTATKGS